MPSSPLGSTNGRTTSGVACQHHLWAVDTVERHRAWHASMTFWKNTVERRRSWHDITSFGQRTRSNDVERDMPSPPLEITNGRTTLGVACHHHLWEAKMVGRHLAWHAIIAPGGQTRLNDVRRGMTSPPLDSRHDRTRLCVACHHRLWAAHTVE